MKADWRAHLPFERTFGPEHPEYLTKDILAQGYKDWVDRYEIVRNQLNMSSIH
jgi:hypothetical protein